MQKLLLFTALAACLLLAGCGKDKVVLLPNADGSVGAVIVTPKEGQAVRLNQANQSVDVSSKTESGELYQMSEDQVRQDFGAVLAADPEPVVKFMLHFGSESTQLKDESRKLLPEIMAAVKRMASTDVSIIGHTDRAGDKAYNMTLSTNRAKAVAKLLMGMGLDPDIVELNSHGENNPIVKTADGVSNRKNRRVEVTVR